ncbi:MarR family winged helix-turn-helix transcriptional regulator [Janthinobacterium sp. HLX7-2]|uniref:MarR family winged helix-turn-helix transcriptional regulator n=1 Tax=Janthinobacterium sp. HLX7-2 TaxID=1259331 RepID=UPI003F21CBC1
MMTNATAAPARDNFVAFMTVFGSAQQVLKDWMQADAQQAQGLGPLHLHALCLCWRNPGGAQRQLVQAMGRDKGQIARMTRELEELGWLLRTPDAQDKRAWRLSVTAAGVKKCLWFEALETRLAGELFAGMAAPDHQRLAQMLVTLQAKLEALAAP